MSKIRISVLLERFSALYLYVSPVWGLVYVRDLVGLNSKWSVVLEFDLTLARVRPRSRELDDADYDLEASLGSRSRI